MFMSISLDAEPKENEQAMKKTSPPIGRGSFEAETEGGEFIKVWMHEDGEQIHVETREEVYDGPLRFLSFGRA